MENFQLNDGLVLPAIGFGTYKLNGSLGVNAITSALYNGYRYLDCAFNYENEGAVGQAIKNSGISRGKIIVASKLPGRHHRYQEAIQTIQESLFRMNLDYLDLYLIHWPDPIQDQYVEAWQALIDAQKFGLVRSIGVSNFLPTHLERLEKETGILPSINQVELHPYFNQEEQRKYDQRHGILTQDWSPLARGRAVTDEKVITNLAAKYNKKPQQIILRWEIQLKTMPIPKSSTNEHQKSNLELFDFQLTDSEVEEINQLTRSNGRNKNQDPAVYEEF
ncbi:aldo/keto reductase [Xylocopilactobacillus apicola]|uniref:2,5-diketo-D-gluconic acid reductase n=1 Tax=Xylocopilactobacillus apicola TaxID=2932184 RepID=A0AAU9D4T4_9LACO|nr:aldo/keto reductase [Xylocopilactobacillus apicola]BDR58779.1 2,5-diketo-D-gluconic acid reductase [Xylocopilactobacillus apicola]